MWLSRPPANLVIVGHANAVVEGHGKNQADGGALHGLAGNLGGHDERGGEKKGRWAMGVVTECGKVTKAAGHGQESLHTIAYLKSRSVSGARHLSICNGVDLV